MNESNLDKEIKERLSSIAPPSLLNTVVDHALGNKPRGWGRRTNAPYYKRIYAEQIKKEIDEKMIQKGKSLLFRYSVFCNEKTRMSHATLYNRIYQSIRYLVERMDTLDHKYEQWLERVTITRPAGVGILIEYIPGFSFQGGEIGNFEAEAPEDAVRVPGWKAKLQEWLESDNEEPFVMEGLVLSEDEIKQLKIELAGLQGIGASIKSSSIKVVKGV